MLFFFGAADEMGADDERPAGRLTECLAGRSAGHPAERPAVRPLLRSADPNQKPFHKTLIMENTVTRHACAVSKNDGHNNHKSMIEIAFMYVNCHVDSGMETL